MWFRPARVVETTTEMETAGRRTQWNERSARLCGTRPAGSGVSVRRARRGCTRSEPRPTGRRSFRATHASSSVIGSARTTAAAAFPGPFYLPAWDRVAMDWDAVRFTLSGLIDNDFALVEALRRLHDADRRGDR